MHNSSRYLIFFQYIGTKYCGAARGAPQQPLKRGVQDHLEESINLLKPLEPVTLHVSSRTDTGVHALSNSAHFDLQRRNDKPPFSEDTLLEALNFGLRTEQIRVNRVCRVPDDFHARHHALSRTYVYRIALGVSHQSQLPLTEKKLCWSLRQTELDVEAMREAAALLLGKHDFNSFRAISTEMAFKDPVRTLDVAVIQPGISFANTHFHREVPFWELTFNARSFLYKQVRRMTGALVAVGQGRLSIPKLKDLLEARDSRAYPQGMVAPAHGLFLSRVDYRESDLQLSQPTPDLPSTGNSH